jgi:hypothetical protein
MARPHAPSHLNGQPISSGFRRAMGRRCWFTAIALVVLIASQGAVAPCRAAGLVIEALNFVVLPGSSGSFDVVLINTNATGGPSYDVAADSLDISLAAPAGFTITDVNMGTSANYIFTESIDANFGLPLAMISSPTSFTSNDAGDAVNGYPGYEVVNPGQTYGLAHVDYTTGATTSGLVTISFSDINVGTSLSDPNGNPIGFTTIVPEPSALIQGATAALISLGVVGWRRRSIGSRCGR